MTRRAILDELVVHGHIITSRHGVPLMVERNAGLVVEVTDSDTLGYRGSFFYDLAKNAVIRLAYAVAADLHAHRVTAVGLTPGLMRSEAVFDHCGVTEVNWRNAIEQDPYFAESGTPCYVGRAVAALGCELGAWEWAWVDLNYRPYAYQAPQSLTRFPARTLRSLTRTSRSAVLAVTWDLDPPVQNDEEIGPDGRHSVE